MKKTIGIMGGMGPLATADLYKKIVLNTDASRDGDHIHVVIDSNTAVPDRTAAILGAGESPVPELVKSAKLLENAGVDFLIVPCNTAHYFLEDVLKQTKLPALNMLRLTAEEIKRRGIGKVALLATEGTIKTGIYARLFEEYGIPCLVPDNEQQRAVMDVIYNGIKAGKTQYDTAAFEAALHDLMRAGAEAFVLGCTELPIAFADYGLDYPVVDPTLVLARAAIAEAGYRVVS